MCNKKKVVDLVALHLIIIIGFRCIAACRRMWHLELMKKKTIYKIKASHLIFNKHQ